MYFDTHAHYCDKQFNEDRDSLLASMPANDVSLILNAGSNIARSAASVELADKYSFVYASVGAHPHDARNVTDENLIEIERLLAHPKAVAVGEIGLDYHYDFSPRDVQKLRFRQQLELAQRVGKPVIIHEREALEDTLDLVREFRDVGGVFHCFSGSWETAKTILDLGWYLSFTGILTFKNARRAVDVVAKMPMDRLMLETDCPYMAPEPMRGRRNSSLLLHHIAKKVAEIRGLPLEDVAKVTTENGKRLFRITKVV